MAETKHVELLELEDGQVIVRDTDAEGEGATLMTIEFNKSVEQYFGDQKMNICREMLTAGLQAASDINESYSSFWMSQRPVSAENVDRETLIKYFEQEHPAELTKHLTLH